MTRIIVYTRRDCPLCDEAIRALEEAGAAFQLLDVASDASLESEHGSFVPVVEVDGHIVFHAGMDPAELPELVT